MRTDHLATPRIVSIELRAIHVFRSEMVGIATTMRELHRSKMAFNERFGKGLSSQRFLFGENGLPFVAEFQTERLIEDVPKKKRKRMIG